MFRNRSDPRNTNIDTNGNSSNDPDDLTVILAIVAEDDGEYDTTEVTSCADYTTEDTIGEGMDVRHDGEVGAVRGIHEDGEAGDESEHGGFVVRVEETDGEFETTHRHAAEDDPHLLAPDRAGVFVDDVCDDAAEWAEEDVQEPEHGCPAAGAGLSKVGEVLEVV